MFFLQPRSIHTASSNGSMGSSKAPSTVPYDSSASHEIVETMHAEIELLMLSGGYSRDVAVKMLLNKVAKEKGLQSQNTVSAERFPPVFWYVDAHADGLYLHCGYTEPRPRSGQPPPPDAQSCLDERHSGPARSPE